MYRLSKHPLKTFILTFLLGLMAQSWVFLSPVELCSAFMQSVSVFQGNEIWDSEDASGSTKSVEQRASDASTIAFQIRSARGLIERRNLVREVSRSNAISAASTVSVLEKALASYYFSPTSPGVRRNLPLLC
ncbi:MAG: hypothetical protein H7249_01800 [Chitinophagaceae bacterium]|nr:hypothetical protein [Oligoflexus sp.]